MYYLIDVNDGIFPTNCTNVTCDLSTLSNNISIFTHTQTHTHCMYMYMYIQAYVHVHDYICIYDRIRRCLYMYMYLAVF